MCVSIQRQRQRDRCILCAHYLTGVNCGVNCKHYTFHMFSSNVILLTWLPIVKMKTKLMTCNTLYVKTGHFLQVSSSIIETNWDLVVSSIMYIIGNKLLLAIAHKIHVYSHHCCKIIVTLQDHHRLLQWVTPAEQNTIPLSIW